MKPWQWWIGVSLICAVLIGTHLLQPASAQGMVGIHNIGQVTVPGRDLRIAGGMLDTGPVPLPLTGGNLRRAVCYTWGSNGIYCTPYSVDVAF